jgi:MSHA biogenesis protein MshO
VAMSNARGFTLLELVVTIAISAIVLVFASMFVQVPADAYMASARQAELQDSISIAWPRMQADIQLALPNSARSTTNGTVELLELLPIADSGRYLSTPGGNFRTAGFFDRKAPQGYYMAIHNDPANGLDAYNPASKLMTTAGAPIDPKGSSADEAAGEDLFNLSPAFTFSSTALANPALARHRIYLVQKPVSYLCDPKAGTLQRYSGYSVKALQSSVNTAAKLLAAGATASLTARNITACKFTALTASGSASQTVTVVLTAARDGETTNLHETAAVRSLE